MNMLIYAWLHIKRNLKTTIITLCSYLSVLALIMSVQQSVHSRQTALTDMAAAIDVQCVVADNMGAVTMNLKLGPAYYRPFIEATSLSDLVKDVNLCSKNSGMISQFSCQLKGITSEAADENLRYGNNVIYAEGFAESIWMSEEQVCAISPELERYTYVGADGGTYIHVDGRFYSDHWQDFRTVPLTLRVVGSVYGYNSVYAPVRTLLKACEESQESISFSADSMSFAVRDNHRLDALRSQVSSLFLEAGETNRQGYSLLIKDTQYLKLTREAEKNLTIMQLMQPVLYLCALGAGVMLVVMQMRGRKKEMAVIRSLGAGRFRVMAQSILEYALICLPVTLFALLVWRELSPMTVFGVWLAFMAGALMTIIRFTQIPLVKQIRELEE